MVRKLLKFIDLYGKTSQFTIFRKDVHKTEFGGLLSLLSIISMIFSIISFGKNFYQRKNPNYIYQRVTTKDYTNYIIDNTNFFINIIIADDFDNLFNDSEYFEIEASYRSYVRNEIGGNIKKSTKILESLNCSDINNDIEEYKLNSFKNGKCFNISNLKFGGYWDGNEINFLNFKLKYCLNSSNCKNFSDIKNKMNNNQLEFNLYTQKTFVDLNDKQNLFKKNIQNFFSTINQNMLKSKSIFYSRLNISTDFGILTDMNTTRSFISVGNEINDFQILNESNFLSELIDFNLFLDADSDIYTIRDIKLQDLFASLGGIFSIINVFFSTIAEIYNTYDKNIKLMNKLFDFSNLSDNKEMIKILRNQKKETVDFSFRNSNILSRKFDEDKDCNHKENAQVEMYDTIEKSNVWVTDLSLMIKKEIKKKNSKFYLNPSLFNIISNCTIKNKREEIIFKLYVKARDIINEKLDIVQYLKFFEEYIALKSILINEFSNLSLTLRNKPKLYEDNNFNNLHLSKIERLKKLINIYTVNRNSRFYDILDDQIKIALEKNFNV